MFDSGGCEALERFMRATAVLGASRREDAVGRQSDDVQTRARLIEVATRQFAVQGYRRVTIRALSREARANVAAVNYHFGDKLGLYREVIEAAVAMVRETTDEAVRAGEGLAPDDQFRSYVQVQCARMFAHDGYRRLRYQLLYREMQDQTEVFSAFIERALRARHEYLAGIVSALLDLPADDSRVGLAATSVQAQIAMFRPNPIGDRLRARLKMSFTPSEIAEHIYAFSIDGLRGGRRKR